MGVETGRRKLSIAAERLFERIRSHSPESGQPDPLDTMSYDDLFALFSTRQLFELWWSRVYLTGKWEADTRALIEGTLQPGDLFVDIGAWIGPVTLWALQRTSRVIAVEPDPVALTELRRRVPGSVEVWEGAVAPRRGTAALTASKGRFGMSASRLAQEGELRVRTWALPEILGDRKPTLVKIDIEGYEIELLPAIAPYLAELGASLQVALHGTLPDPSWFEAYGEVRIPEDPHGTVLAGP